MLVAPGRAAAGAVAPAAASAAARTSARVRGTGRGIEGSSGRRRLLYTVKPYAGQSMSEQPRRQSLRGRLTRERVVDAALELIERDGAEALSMRRLGGELGVEAMALYSYVRSKDELLDAVAERLVAGLELRPVAREDWRGRIRAVVDAWSAIQLRHPR